MRLTKKLGNRSNASAEIEYAVGWPVGEPGHGIATMMAMVAVTRLVLTNSSAAAMRAGLTQAIHHATHRAAFGRHLVDQPLMRGVLADLAVESEAALALSQRLFAELDLARGADHRLDAYVGRLCADLAERAELETRARQLAERLALALQGALLVRHSPPAVADAFCASRLDERHCHSFGTLPTGLAPAAIVERATIKAG